MKTNNDDLIARNSDLEKENSELKESVEKYRKMFENVQDVFFQSDRKGIIIDISPSIERYSGYTRESLIGISVAHVYKYPEDQYKILSLLHKEGEIVDYYLHLLHKSGKSVFSSLNAHWLKDAEGKIIGMEGSLRDISERKKAEQSLKESEEHLKTIYNIVGTGIVIINSETFEIIEANKTASKLFGLPLEEIIGRKCKNFICFNEIGNCPIKDEGHTIINTERKLRTASGVMKDILKTVFPIKYKGVDCYIESFMDISDLKNKEEELTRLNEDLRCSRELVDVNLFEKNVLIEELEQTKLNLEESLRIKDRFFSIIAHDLKSPFTGFLILTELMSERLKDLSITEVQKFSKSLMQSASNLHKLIENLLEWSRMQRGLIQLEPEEFQFSKVLQGNIDLIEEIAKKKEIKIINSIPDDFSVFADISMINSIIRNLLSNALKFTSKGGNIIVGVNDKPSADCHEIYIKDSGVGMNEMTLSKLFKIEKKMSHNGTEGETGTGLGLILCKEFVEKQGGKIRVESEEGKGSTFYFTLLRDQMILN